MESDEHCTWIIKDINNKSLVDLALMKTKDGVKIPIIDVLLP